MLPLPVRWAHQWWHQALVWLRKLISPLSLQRVMPDFDARGESDGFTPSTSNIFVHWICREWTSSSALSDSFGTINSLCRFFLTQCSPLNFIKIPWNSFLNTNNSHFLAKDNHFQEYECLVNESHCFEYEQWTSSVFLSHASLKDHFGKKKRRTS